MMNVLGEYEDCFSTTDGSMISSVCPNSELKQVGSGAAYNVFNCDHETKVATVLTAVAPDVSLIPVQVYSEFGWQKCDGTPAPCGRSYPSDQMEALEYLLKLKQDGIDISAVNLSLNGGAKFTGSCDDDPRKESVDNLLSYGVVTIALAGNQGFIDGVQVPACISSAVEATDADGNVAEFSNRGGELDLLAPGVMIVDGKLIEGSILCQSFDGNANDISGNGNHGIEKGGITYVDGKFGQAVKFDGIDTYLDIPHSENLNLQQMTISVWVYDIG